MTSNQIRQSFLDFFKSKGHSIVSSSSLMPDSPNLLFTNAGMNQFVPIFLGEQPCPYNPPRAADTQKCIRAGGKHNDLEDVGLDTYHHTFFEMLGNWSFGDYFKKEAIEWAWELVTGIWKFPKERIYATVYSPDKSKGDPSEFDQEAYDFWAEKFTAAGLDPKVHIVNGNKKDNFWMMGETGPCGPCSELHVDLTPNGDTKGALVNKGSAECIEIWNLVFIQFNANPDGTFSPLPARHVDTGMGFERVTAIMQGTMGFTDFKGIISNYETDVFRPIFERLEKMSGKRYASTLPKTGSTGDTEQEKIDVAFRVIADHIRTLSFAIADGILPGNNGRNYVLRRILRRAVRYGRTLGFHQPFFYQLVDVLSDTMGHVFPEVRTRQEQVKSTIRTEEESFNRTLDRGIELFKEEAQNLKGATQLSGAFAFKLYDTYGFPLDLTELMAREAGLSVEQAGFDRLMDEQKKRAQAAQKKEIISLSNIESNKPTEFIGFEHLESRSKVAEVVKIKEKLAVILQSSPFYAEMGGQVGDTGQLIGSGQVWHVVNTQKVGPTFVHFIAEDEAPEVGSEVQLIVDKARRNAIQRHHSVTHLLHWALHEIVSREASQKGSFVGPDKLTFDFNGSALSAVQLRDVERLVNERILENSQISWKEVPYSEVRNRQDVMQFFGDKYGDLVRVVQIGGASGALDGFSMELCGGTHARGTGEIGMFRILSESATAAGVRRIEAVAGLTAYEKSLQDLAALQRSAEKINAPIAEFEKKLDSLIFQQKALEKQMKSLQQKQAAATARELEGKRQTLGQTPAIIHNIGQADGEQLQSIADALKGSFEGVVVLAGSIDQSVSLVATVSPAFTNFFQAGKIIQQIAPIIGGKGGGKPDAARGGGKEPSKINEALQKAASMLS
ncbi:MAG: alanine--tRNA ligase [Verrucomicrobiales bacterium]